MMKKMLKDGDLVKVSEEISAEVIGEKKTISLPAGTTGAIVMVYENGKAYEIEFYISKTDIYALATVPSEKVKSLEKM